MPIPLYTLPSLQQTNINAPAPNQNAMSAQARGLQQTAQGIAAIGGVLGEHADRVQALENTWQESEARQAIAADFSQFETELQNNPDPASYLPKLDETLHRTQQHTSRPDLSPLVSQKLALYHSDFAANARIRVAERAAAMTTQRAKLALSNEMDAAMTYGDRSSFDSAKSRALESGLLLPEQADTMSTRFEEAATYQSLIGEIDADPATALDQLSTEDIGTRYPHLTPENRDRLQRYATTQKNNHVAQTWLDVQKASLDGIVLEKNEIMQMMREGDLTPEQAGRYLSSYHGPKPPEFNPVIFDQARSQILSYDPAKDPTGSVRASIAAELATTSLPPEYVKELVKQFEDRSNPESPNKNKHKLAKDYNDRIASEWKAESFGNWFSREASPVDGRIVSKIITEGDFDKAIKYRNQFSDYFNAWLEQQPQEIDPLEVGKKYDEIKSQVLKQQPPADITLPSLAPPSFDDPLQGLNPDGSPSLLPPKPQETPTETNPKTSSLGTFGGQPIPPPGVFIKRAKTTIFGGNADPNDNGLSANGGPNNDVAGVAIPQKMLQAMFPGKDKAWHFQNVKVVVKADNGITKTLPLRDYGTAERITERNNNHVLDLNPKAVSALGGSPVYKDGKLTTHNGFSNVDFAITTDNAQNLDPKTTSPEELKSAWFKDKKPTHPDQIESGLHALQSAQALTSIE